MSSSNNLETTAKIKLAELSAKLDFVIKEVIEDMATYIKKLMDELENK